MTEKVHDVAVFVDAYITSLSQQPAALLSDPDGTRQNRARTVHSALVDIVDGFRGGAHLCFQTPPRLKATSPLFLYASLDELYDANVGMIFV